MCVMWHYDTGTMQKHRRNDQLNLSAPRMTPTQQPDSTPCSASCAICGNAFTPKKNVHNQKYCSKECCHEASDRRSQGDRWILFHRDSFRCSYCGRSPIDVIGVQLRLDHIVPYSDGGECKAYNLITTCAACNGAKHANRLESTLELWVLDEVRKRNEKHRISPHKVIKNMDNGRLKPRGHNLSRS